MRPLATVVILFCLSLSAASCGSAGSGGAGIRVVAAENFWGSIASQLAGEEASVQTIITNPAEDPHSYEPKASDGRSMASSQLAIVNGVGYDLWASRLLAASPVSGRITLDVGELLRLKDGENPHRWYSPQDVGTVATAITSDLKRLDPTDAAFFDRQLTAFEQQGLAKYHAVIARIERRYAGTAVGASESIFALLAPNLGLNLLTPPGFMKAITEGTDVTASDLAEAQRQIQTHQIKVWIYNAQNATPQVAQLGSLARAAHIPVVTITETLSPPSDSFEQWQVDQLLRLERALRQATGR